jgi:hypothetical protein
MFEVSSQMDKFGGVLVFFSLATSKFKFDFSNSNSDGMKFLVLDSPSCNESTLEVKSQTDKF